MLDYIRSVDDNQRGAAGGEPPKPESLRESVTSIFAPFAAIPKKRVDSSPYTVKRDSEIASRNERPKPESRVESAISILALLPTIPKKPVAISYVLHVWSKTQHPGGSGVLSEYRFTACGKSVVARSERAGL